MKKWIFLILSPIVIYSIAYLFFDIPPYVKPNIDFYKQRKLTEYPAKELRKMRHAMDHANFFEGLCLRKYLNARDDAILLYCNEHHLGDNTGGGCYHGLGTYIPEDSYFALRYCKIYY